MDRRIVTLNVIIRLSHQLEAVDAAQCNLREVDRPHWTMRHQRNCIRQVQLVGMSKFPLDVTGYSREWGNTRLIRCLCPISRLFGSAKLQLRIHRITKQFAGERIRGNQVNLTCWPFSSGAYLCICMHRVNVNSPAGSRPVNPISPLSIQLPSLQSATFRPVSICDANEFPFFK